jgi:CubicO group peptidase (beta-lactamase class C family)
MEAERGALRVEFGVMVIACLTCVSQVAVAADRFGGMDEYIKEAMDRWQVPGLAIAVVKDGEVVLTRAYGQRQVNADDAPVTTDTVFSIASCTKSFTACAIAMLVDEGKLKWDDTVVSHLPNFKVADPYVTEHVTIRDLLCHRTGLVRGDLLPMRGDVSHDEMLRRLQYLQQAEPFRSKFTYSSLMYDVLGEVIQAKTGKSWQEFVTERILKPLEMHSTTTDRAALAANQIAVRHRIYDDGIAPLRTPISDQRVAPAAAIHSTVGDMANWLTFHLREGRVGKRQLIRKDVMREMYTLQQSIPVKWRPASDVYDARFIGTGLGWFVRDYRGRKVVQHGGAWGAETAILPEEDLAVVVLSNRDWNGLTWMLIFDVIDAYLVGPERAWEKGEKWDKWLPLGGPQAMDKTRKKQLAELTETRKKGTKPSVPLRAFAGDYYMPFYGDLQVAVVDGKLHASLGEYSADLQHWDGNRFYSRAPIEPFMDWLVTFDVDDSGTVRSLGIVHIGWPDQDERFVFAKR